MNGSIRMPSCIVVMGLGYVGLPEACALSRFLPVIGFDIDSTRVQELKNGRDRNEIVDPQELKKRNLRFTDDPQALVEGDFFIIEVPTPVDEGNRPDLSYLKNASRQAGRAIHERSRDPRYEGHPPIIVYGSTVYPGCTEEVCIPVLERESGLKAGIDFKVGYSPERINPGDPDHTLEKVVKLVAAGDPDTSSVMAAVYGLAVKAGVYQCPDIKTAEAAKVIENVQRDLNIALMNELAILFHKFGLNTQEVLKAAQTKWNFLPFQPGLVGGHCIPVDPYYLTYKAQQMGYHPSTILAGREINDSMGSYLAQITVELLAQAGTDAAKARVIVLGAAFKEDIRDCRNTRVTDLAKELEKHGCQVFVYDPLVDQESLKSLDLRPVADPFLPERAIRSGPGTSESNISITAVQPSPDYYDAVILAVPHSIFREKGMDAYLSLLKKGDGPGVLVDVKSAIPRDRAEQSGVLYWSL